MPDELLNAAALDPNLVGPTLPPIPSFTFPTGPTGQTGPTGPLSPCGMPSCQWSESPNNPVYNPPTDVYYQTVRYSSTGFIPFGSFAFYKMWYDYESTGGIALATSSDGINWTFDSNITGLISTARHSRVLFDSAGFGIGAPYRIWYWDLAHLYITECSSSQVCMIRTANSVDGINWTEDTTLLQNPSSPLLDASAYNRGSYEPADILYFSENIGSDPNNPFNSRYVMYYNITDGATEQIALAVSGDGITWSKAAGPLAVLPHGTPGQWDENYATEHAVVLRLSPNNFKMWYSSGINSSHEGIGCASSIDGINWIKFLGNLIFSINDGVPWRNMRTYNPWVLFDSSRFSGHGDLVCYKFWMTGAPIPSDKKSIGYATNLLG
ncbi:exosporium leader peptide-containing protein [Bacillus thuringiensis]|uniref:exosporium leader peptide-containing protein n=1 Tax=Bacillus thuringiensis TaxID=1428 RepID=UPI002413DEE5|nr:exosporium leader peptide-containing protein [Bacillus thuringiensis]